MAQDPPAPFRVAIVGTGPAGFYAAQALHRLRAFPVAVDLFDRLPTPFGLVRGGVAPDHPNIKAVTRGFTRVVQRAPALRFFGNVHIGRDLSVEALAAHYDAVVWAVGAEGGRRLGIPGEDLSGVLPAASFVYWYNGHPDYSDLAVALGHVRRALVVGNGNVALDVARILSRDVGDLARTDIADHALSALRASPLEQVGVLGRRGPAQASFTLAELRELGQLNGVDLQPVLEEPPADAPAAARDAEQAAEPRQARLLQQLREAAQRAPSGAPRALQLRFLTSVVGLEGDAEGRLARVQLRRNALRDEGGRLVARPVGAPWWEPAQLLLLAIGYRGPEIPGLPYDASRGGVRNEGGRVVDGDGARLPRHYVTGWARRGPSGVIGTNKPDAQEVVAALWEDLHAGTPRTPVADVAETLAARGVRWVDFDGWTRIDALEVAAGAAQGRPRVKRTHWTSLLDAAQG